MRCGRSGARKWVRAGGHAFGTTRPKGTTGRTASRRNRRSSSGRVSRASDSCGGWRRRRDRDFRRAGTHQLLRVLRGQPVQEELIELELGRGEFVHVRHLDVPWGRGGAREGKGRSRQDERHNVQNEARCDPAEARSPRGDARDAPEVSISGTLCSPLTLSPAIAPATGVTHSGARRRRGGSQLLGCDNGSTRALSFGHSQQFRIRRLLDTANSGHKRGNGLQKADAFHRRLSFVFSHLTSSPSSSPASPAASPPPRCSAGSPGTTARSASALPPSRSRTCPRPPPR